MNTEGWRNRAFQVVLALCVLSGIGAIALSIQEVRSRQHDLQAQKEDARKIAREQASAINKRLARITPAALRIASDLSSGALKDKDIYARIKRSLEADPDLFEIGVAYSPFSKDPSVRLYAPHVARTGDSLEEFDLATRYDYTDDAHYHWFKDGLAAAGPHWGEPYFGSATQKLVVGYSVPFYRPGNTNTPIGLVRTNLSLDHIHAIVSGVSLGATGYGFLLSRKGVYISDPATDYVRNQRTIFQIADELGDASRKRIGDRAVAGQPAEEESFSGVTRQATWIFSEPVTEAGWSMGTVFMRNEVAMDPRTIRRGLINIACCSMLFLWLLSILPFRRREATVWRLWGLVLATAWLFIAAISLIWWLTLRYPDRSGDRDVHLFSDESVEKFLSNEVTGRLRQADAPPPILTGIFIRTMRFEAGNDVILAGQIWQRRSDGGAGGAGSLAGFQFPDAESVEIKEAYHIKDQNREVAGWEFKATLREPFEDANKYPFDRAVVRIRIAPKEFYTSSFLAPDLSAYQLRTVSSLPGLDKALALPGWRLDQSFFSYVPVDHGTTFGLVTDLLHSRSHELVFTVIAQRQFLDPFIFSVLPIIVVAVLLFGMLMIASKDSAKVEATGFKAASVLSGSAALLFPVLIAQVNLRSKMGSSTIIYIEYFYFVLYTAILGVATNALLFTATGRGFSQYRDNLIPKLLFWPYLLGAFFGVTLLFLY